MALRNITITVSEEVAHWARRRAAEESTSVSKLVGHMLEAQMRISDEYWKAYERWQSAPSLPGLAAARPGREELNERPR